jgi:hypothetical protein
MPSDYSAFASDFYINQRLNLKMDLAMRRDTVLSLFDRVRREIPAMDRFKRYSDELALESRTDPEGGSSAQQWLAIRKTSVRSGAVNPDSVERGYDLHRLVLESAPYFLDISPLDIDHVEILYGFDLPAAGNHDGIVFNALYAGSPLAALVDGPDEGRPANYPVVDCQPLVGVALSEDTDLQAHFEIKTRVSARQIRQGDFREEPISIYLIVRRYGPFNDVKDLAGVQAELSRKGEELLDSVVLPKLVVPIRDASTMGG